MSESKRVLVRDDEGCSQIVPLNRKKILFTQEDVGPYDPSAPFGIAPGPFKRPEPKVGINGSFSSTSSTSFAASTASSGTIDYSMIRAIVREEVRSILREELSKMFENFKN